MNCEANEGAGDDQNGLAMKLSNVSMIGLFPVLLEV